MMGRRRYKRKPVTGFVPSRADELEVLEAGRREADDDPEPEDEMEAHFKGIMEEPCRKQPVQAAVLARQGGPVAMTESEKFNILLGILWRGGLVGDDRSCRCPWCDNEIPVERRVTGVRQPTLISEPQFHGTYCPIYEPDPTEKCICCGVHRGGHPNVDCVSFMGQPKALP